MAILLLSIPHSQSLLSRWRPPPYPPPIKLPRKSSTLCCSSPPPSSDVLPPDTQPPRVITAEEDPRFSGCKSCGREQIEKGCNGEGRIQGGIATVPGFGWWPIKAFRPCPGFVSSGGRYRRRGQSMDEVTSGRGRDISTKSIDKDKSRKPISWFHVAAQKCKIKCIGCVKKIGDDMNELNQKGTRPKKIEGMRNVEVPTTAEDIDFSTV